MITETFHREYVCVDIENADETNRVVIHVHRFPNGIEVPRRIIVRSAAWDFDWGIDKNSLDCERRAG